MMNLTLFSQLAGSVYTLSAVVTGAVGAVTFRWVPNVPNRQPKVGNPITRTFNPVAAVWSETCTATDSAGNTATAVIALDLVSDSPPVPPPTGTPTIPIDAATEAALAAIPVGGSADLQGPAFITTITRV
jgi:hypothetical protein